MSSNSNTSTNGVVNGPVRCLVVVGDAAKMKEAGKSNPLLGKLMHDISISEGQKQIQIGAQGQKDLDKNLEDWKKAMRMEMEKNEGVMPWDVSFVIVGGDGKKSTGTATTTRSEETDASKPTKSSSSRVYSHDLGDMSAAWLKALSLDEEEVKGGKGPSKASTEATGSSSGKKASSGASAKAKGDKPKTERSLPKFRGLGPGEEKSVLQVILENGVPSMQFHDVDIIDVDTEGATNTAEILERAINSDTIPTDPITRKHFGFSKCDNTDGEVNLVGLYTGLFFYLKVTTGQVHEWRKDNKLAAGIFKAYHPRDSGYLQWFRKNLHLVDANYNRPGGLKAPPSQGQSISESFYDH